MNISCDSRVISKDLRVALLKRVLEVLTICVTGLASIGSSCGADLDAPVELLYEAELRLAPQWSADGSKIVFSRPPIGVFVVESDGTRMWPLPPDAPVVDPTLSVGNFSPAMSPDGSRVAYAAAVASKSSDIVTSALDGSGLRKLTGRGSTDAHPVWSPDGSQILFYSDRSVSSDHPTSGLYIVNSDGPNLRDLEVPVTAYPEYLPQWSSTGDRISFVAIQVDRVGSGEDLRDVWRYIAYTVRPDGSELTELGDAVSAPAWSPDGTRIALVRAFGGEDDERRALYTMSPDGSDQRELLSIDWAYDVRYDTLAWSPDGTEILYGSSSYRSDPSIVVVAVANSETRIVGEFPRSRHKAAAWSPDGSRIAIYVNYGDAIGVDPEEANVVLLTVARDGSDRRILVRGNEDRLVAVKSDWRDVSGDTAACSAGQLVPNPEKNPGLVEDCETLLRIRDTLAGDAVLNWSAAAPMSQWRGVIIKGSPSRVTLLSLTGADPVPLTGSIPPELGNLTALDKLRLGSNRLTGNIPPELGNLINLRELDLGSNALTGSIPAELGRLTNLQTLELARNGLEGIVPAELGSLSRLEVLLLNHNRLTGNIPPELGNLSSLEDLRLNRNQLTGAIPLELVNLVTLETLLIDDNNLTGCIPKELSGRLVWLETDELEYC